jgi:DNA polymerase III alpha subunit (gram-positive type)
MRYCSIDCETTGLNRETCQILEIGAIIEDCGNPLPFDKLPKRRIVIDRHQVTGEPYAINMNARIFKMLAQAQDIKDKVERDAFKEANGIVSEDGAVRMLWEFLYLHGFGEKYTVSMDKPENNAGLTYEQAMSMAGGDLSKIELPKLNRRHQIKVNVAGKNFATFDKVFLEKLPGFTDLIRFRQRILDPVTSYADFLHDEEAPGMDKCFTKLGVGHMVSHDAVDDAWGVIQLLRPLYLTYDTRILAMNLAHLAQNSA